VFVSGVNGGFQEPADLIYDRFALELSHQGVPSIFVSYRYAGDIGPSVEDALAAASYLRDRGVKKMAVVGWSFGAAVAISSAVKIPETVTVTTFSGQSRDTEPVADFTKQSLLVVHSKQDENVPFFAAQEILDAVPPGVHTQFFPLEEGDHLLDGMSALVDPVFRTWLRQELLNQPAARSLDIEDTSRIHAAQN
jgi:dienelactone hydrolase